MRMDAVGGRGTTFGRLVRFCRRGLSLGRGGRSFFHLDVVGRVLCCRVDGGVDSRRRVLGRGRGTTVLARHGVARCREVAMRVM